MAPKFGTSGLRGLVTELSDALVTDYTRAFLSACPQGRAVHVGWDLRPSSPAIAETVIAAIRDAGLTAIREGALPTPALALASMGAGNAAIMVTGSHIPADRNGLKFYVPHGEIAKEDEAAILDRLGQDHPVTEKCGSEIPGADTAAHYIARYVDAFGSEALEGLRIGVYQHSSVARDILVTAIEAMGATAVPLARSDEFIPVDTEAIAPETRETLQGWCTEQRLDAVISTDGDADRPMLTDETGTLIPGDVLGALTARLLGAKILCTPVSANTMVDAMPEFDSIHRTKIGSPFVIAAMGAARAADPAAKVAGYEPNGGFLLGFTATGPVGQIAPLATRDCLLPIVAPLVAAKKAGTALSGLVAQLPARFTAADRVAEVSTDRSRAFIDRLAADPVARREFFSDFDPAERIDQTDGLRLTFPSGEIVHLRPSGNAPECRCYAEAATPERAESLVASYLAALRTELT